MTWTRIKLVCCKPDPSLFYLEPLLPDQIQRTPLRAGKFTNGTTKAIDRQNPRFSHPAQEPFSNSRPFAPPQQTTNINSNAPRRAFADDQQVRAPQQQQFPRAQQLQQSTSFRQFEHIDQTTMMMDHNGGGGGGESSESDGAGLSTSNQNQTQARRGHFVSASGSTTTVGDLRNGGTSAFSRGATGATESRSIARRGTSILFL